jgi:hypothetical protein
MIENKQNDGTLLLEYVKRGLQTEVEKEFNRLKENLIKELDSRKNQICAGILLDVMKNVEMNRMGENVTFTIREIKQ